MLFRCHVMNDNRSDWVTEDLLSKVEKHPNLSKVFQDPVLSQLLVEFQKNPQKAMAAVQDNKEVFFSFFVVICSALNSLNLGAFNLTVSKRAAAIGIVSNKHCYYPSTNCQSRPILKISSTYSPWFLIKMGTL